jgi:hypothetical protein
MFHLNGKKFSCQYEIVSPASGIVSAKKLANANCREIILPSPLAQGRREVAEDP